MVIKPYVYKTRYTQYGPIKNEHIKNQHSDFEKNKEPVVRILGLKKRFTFKNDSVVKFLDLKYSKYG